MDIYKNTLQILVFSKLPLKSFIFKKKLPPKQLSIDFDKLICNRIVKIINKLDKILTPG